MGFSRIFNIGDKSVSAEAVLEASAPSLADMAAFCRRLDDAIFISDTFSEGVTVAAGNINHPWIIMVCVLLQERLAEGDFFAGGLLPVLSNLEIEEVKRVEIVKCFEIFCTCIGVLETDMELQEGLLRLGDYYEVVPSQCRPTLQVIDEDAACALKLYVLLAHFGIVIQRIVLLLKSDSRLETLRDELGGIETGLRVGMKLSEAASAVKGSLGSPKIVEAIEEGEDQGNIEEALEGLLA